MAGFADIIGHEQMIKYIKSAIAMDKMSHAYIFNGPEKSGKRMLAEAFAMALQCEGQADRPCMKCRSCKQAKNHNQPDIIYLQHEKPNTISVDDVRKQINNDIGIRPFSSRYKVYIVDEAEKMNVQAQNALLKTIEEPPSYGVIMLLTTNADSFLPTIRSRCVTLNLKAVRDDQIRKYLMEQLHVPDYKAEVCTAFAQGNVGRAMLLAGSEDFNELKELVLVHLRKIGKADLYEILPMVKEVSPYKTQMTDFFDLLTIWFRDVLLYKSTGTDQGIIFRDLVHDIRRQADKLAFSDINDILQNIHNSRSRLDANVNFELTLEMLYLNMHEKLA